MDALSLIKVIKEAGISIGAFMLCAWMVMYTVQKLAGSLDRLIMRIESHNDHSEERGKYIREEHNRMIAGLVSLQNDHRAVAAEHASMITSLKEIEQALGRINGYKK